MNLLFRPILHARNSPLAIHRLVSITCPIHLGIALHAHTVASSVSMHPGSQTPVEQAATNVKEEFGNSVADLAKVISGANVTTDSNSDTGSVPKQKLENNKINIQSLTLEARINNLGDIMY